MLSGSVHKDLWALLMVTLLLPLAMYGMRGKSRSKTNMKVAAAFFGAMIFFIFSVLSIFSLMYASVHDIDYAAAVYSSTKPAALLCSKRQHVSPLQKQDIKPGVHQVIINVVGPHTGMGWWRETLRTFSSEEGLRFDEGSLASAGCDTDVLQLEQYDENSLLYLPQPFEATFMVRDPRSVVAEQYLKLEGRCNNTGISSNSRVSSMAWPINSLSELSRKDSRHLHRARRRLKQEQDALTRLQAKICSLSKEDGMEYLMRNIQKEGCQRGLLSYVCIASSLPAKVANKQGLHLFKYEHLWTNSSSGFTEVGKLYGLEGRQLQRFVSTGKHWLQVFRESAPNSQFAAMRGMGAWRKHYTAKNERIFNSILGHTIKDLGYESGPSEL